jgi:hypothetical protein
MPKTVLESKFTELEGLDRISQVVHEIKCLFREITKSDYGIDGEIEVCTPKENGKGYQATGGIIKVQAKSGKGYITQDTPNSFSAKSSRDDFEYWHRSNFPTVFIIFHPQEKKLYWKEMKTYLNSTPNVWQSPYKITFNKAEEEFTSACLPRIQNIAQISPSRISHKEQEKLFSNLLEIPKMPDEIWSAPCKVSQHKDILQEVRGFIPPFKIVGKELYTLTNLNASDCVFRPYCEIPNNLLPVPAQTFWNDPDKKRDYVYLINQLLFKHLRRAGLAYSNDFDRYYFPRKENSLEEVKIRWYNIRRGKYSHRPVTVVKYYEYGQDKFWRHTAAKIQVMLFGNSWFLQILPMYFFTVDGRIPWNTEKVGPYTTQIKAQETNQPVLNHVLFWSYVLSGSNAQGKTINIALDHGNTSKSKPIMSIEKMPVTGITDFAIPYDPATYEEPQVNNQISFFDQFNQFGESEDEGLYAEEADSDM